MNHQIDRESSLAKPDFRPSLSPAVQTAAEADARCENADVFAYMDRCRGRSSDDIIDEVTCLVERMNEAPQFLKQVAEFKGMRLVLSATDTAREFMIILDAKGAHVRPYSGEPFDVKIQAAERVHLAVLSGEMDADAAFFAGRVRIRGSVIAAFRVKNRFLSLLQWHLAREFQVTEEFTTNQLSGK